MPKHKKTFNTRLISKLRSYSVNDIISMFGLHKNTVLSWQRNGLKKIDMQKPVLIHGTDLISFLNDRQLRRKKPSKPNELYCLKCARPRLPLPGTVNIQVKSQNRIMIKGNCSSCKSQLFRAGSPHKIEQYVKTFGIEECPTEHIEDHNIRPTKTHLKDY